MMVQPEASESDVEYRVLKFDTHDSAEQALNKWVADGWQLVSYQTAGWDMGISHFLLLSRGKRRSERSIGFGR
jgi:hypothetical protein